MKKLTYLFLSTLIIGAIIALVNHEPTSAIMKTSDGRTWYSAKEMTAVIENEMAKISLYCEETDYDCWNKIYEARASSDNRFFYNLVIRSLTYQFCKCIHYNFLQISLMIF